MQKRKLNYRETWNLTTISSDLSVAANYYPIQTAISIVDEKSNLQLVVMNDRSQGGSAFKNGRIELM
jgi:hypothetical protein